MLNKNEDNLDNSLRLMAPFYRVFANTLGNGPWFDTYIQNLPPSPTWRTAVGSVNVFVFFLALRTRRPSPAGRQRGNEGTTLMLNAIATKENAG